MADAMRPLPVLFVLLALAACLVPSVDLVGKACDPAHPCSAGYQCVANVCEETGGDGGIGGADAGGACLASVCQGNVFRACREGHFAAPEDCGAVDEACDPARGCLARCGSGCLAGEVCDESQTVCVGSPACSQPFDCPGGSCHAGACLAPALAPATVSAGAAPAQLDCLSAPDAGVADGGLITLRGFVRTPSGQHSAATIGALVSVYRAGEYNASAAPQALWSERAFDAGVPDLDGGAMGVGAWAASGIPGGEELVVSVAAPGAVPTHQYLRPGPAAAGIVEVDLVSYSEELWSALQRSAEATPGANRAGISGTVLDCQGRTVAGATVALDTPGAALYTLAGVFAVDPDAKATAASGRFLFFDVPAMPVTVAAELRGDADAVVPVARPVRTRPGSITVVPVR